jgi:hypothetical protein
VFYPKNFPSIVDTIPIRGENIWYKKINRIVHLNLSTGISTIALIIVETFLFAGQGKNHYQGEENNYQISFHNIIYFG